MVRRLLGWFATVAWACTLTSCAAFREARELLTFDNGRASINLAAYRQARRKSCASASLYVVVRYWGLPTSEQEIMRELGAPPQDGYTLRQLRDWARQHGLQAFAVRGTIELLTGHTARGRPLIVTIRQKEQNHSFVVAAVSLRGIIQGMDPSTGKRFEMSSKEFLPRWENAGFPLLIVAPLETKPSSPAAATDAPPLSAP
jgi:ABC-type bacteriocin/lantibiotic exporter with double-glycine peptidase domain